MHFPLPEKRSFFRFYSILERIKPDLNLEEVFEKLPLLENLCKSRNQQFDANTFKEHYAKYCALKKDIELMESIRIHDDSKIPQENYAPVEKKTESYKSLFREMNVCKENLIEAAQKIPNFTSPKSPSNNESAIIEYFGNQSLENKSYIIPADHVDICQNNKIANFRQGSQVVGSKWIYWSHYGAILENALIQYGLQKLLQNQFQLLFPPDVCNEKLTKMAGFHPRCKEKDPNFHLTQNELSLAATSEILLAGFHAGSKITQESMPLNYGALSHCFRTEVGNHGNSSKGLYRLHQFTKLEMFSFCDPQSAEEILSKFVDIQKSVIVELGLRGRLLNVAANDLGNSAYQKYDIEIWYPMLQRWGEVTSASNCTDYQTKRLCIRARSTKAKGIFPVYTVNATLIAVPRIIMGIVENHTSPEGFIEIPRALHPYTFGLTQIPIKKTNKSNSH